MARQKKTDFVGLKVRLESRTYEDEYFESTDEYSQPDTDTSWEFPDIATITDEYPDVTVCFPVKEGDEVFVLYAIHSDGDSYHYDHNHYCSLIDVYASRIAAEEARNRIVRHVKWFRYHQHYFKHEPEPVKEDYFDGTDSVILKRENGDAMRVYASWNGHCESLNTCDVFKVMIVPAREEL